MRIVSMLDVDDDVPATCSLGRPIADCKIARCGVLGVTLEI